MRTPLSTNTWTTVAPRQPPRADLAAATGPDGRLYAIGGVASVENLVGTAYAYTPSTNTWTTVASLPAARAFLAATIGPDGRLYALGGRDSSGNVLSTVMAGVHCGRPQFGHRLGYWPRSPSRCN